MKPNELQNLLVDAIKTGKTSKQVAIRIGRRMGTTTARKQALEIAREEMRKGYNVATGKVESE